MKDLWRYNKKDVVRARRDDVYVAQECQIDQPTRKNGRPLPANAAAKGKFAAEGCSFRSSKEFGRPSASYDQKRTNGNPK